MDAFVPIEFLRLFKSLLQSENVNVQHEYSGTTDISLLGCSPIREQHSVETPFILQTMFLYHYPEFLSLKVVRHQLMSDLLIILLLRDEDKYTVGSYVAYRLTYGE